MELNSLLKINRFRKVVFVSKFIGFDSKFIGFDSNEHLIGNQSEVTCSANAVRSVLIILLLKFVIV